MKERIKRDGDQIRMNCSDCSGEVIFVIPSETGTDRPTLFHTMPYCQRFDDTNTVKQIIQYYRDCGTKAGLRSMN